MTPPGVSSVGFNLKQATPPGSNTFSLRAHGIDCVAAYSAVCSLPPSYGARSNGTFLDPYLASASPDFLLSSVSDPPRMTEYGPPLLGDPNPFGDPFVMDSGKEKEDDAQAGNSEPPEVLSTLDKFRKLQIAKGATSGDVDGGDPNGLYVSEATKLGTPLPMMLIIPSHTKGKWDPVFGGLTAEDIVLQDAKDQKELAKEKAKKARGRPRKRSLTNYLPAPKNAEFVEMFCEKGRSVYSAGGSQDRRTRQQGAANGGNMNIPSQSDIERKYGCAVKENETERIVNPGRRLPDFVVPPDPVLVEERRRVEEQAEWLRGQMGMMYLEHLREHVVPPPALQIEEILYSSAWEGAEEYMLRQDRLREAQRMEQLIYGPAPLPPQLPARPVPQIRSQATEVPTPTRRSARLAAAASPLKRSLRTRKLSKAGSLLKRGKDAKGRAEYALQKAVRRKAFN
ncbi:hypothetical protein AX16_003428 [Volvariella volvacea WC 439]|nr:hypothetical protein AX16_003428 [Volvariella volvacea WC 439]